jgi:hypothetical protein
VQSVQGAVRQSPGLPGGQVSAQIACAVEQSAVTPSGHPPKVQKEPSPQWQKRVAWLTVHEGSVVVVVEVVVVVVGASQTPPAPHAPVQQSKFERQPSPPVGMHEPPRTPRTKKSPLLLLALPTKPSKKPTTHATAELSARVDDDQ